MTDSKTVVEDLASWLTAVWDEEERAARFAHDLAESIDYGIVDFQWVRFVRDTPGGMVRSHSFDTGAPSPASVLARIAAYKGILALHRHVTDPAGWIDCIACGEQGRAPGDVAYAFCEHVRLLASPYADREGFRPEWLVERQGVEG